MKANIQIRNDEMRVITNSEFFRTKHQVSAKIKLLFGELRNALKNTTPEFTWIPPQVDIETGRIFQGENYKQLPYIILDYPKLFGKTSVFSFRTMFWWGHHFSFTLHLEGEALEERRDALIKNSSRLKDKGFYICVHHSPWEYHYETDNYCALEKTPNLEEVLQASKFIKLSRKLSLYEWEETEAFAVETFVTLMNALQ